MRFVIKQPSATFPPAGLKSTNTIPIAQIPNHRGSCNWCRVSKVRCRNRYLPCTQLECRFYVWVRDPWCWMCFWFCFFLKRGSDFSELGGWTQTPEKGILLELEASGVVRSGCLEVAEAPAPQFNEPPVAFLGIWEAKGLFISRLRFAAGTYICKYWVLTPTWIPDHLPFGLRYYVPPYLLPFFRDFHIMGSSEMENQLSTGWINSWVTRISMKWSKPLWICVSSQFSWLQLPDRVK